MKRIFTTLIVMAGLTTAAFAQTSLTKGSTEFGVMIGLNNATVTESSGNNQNAGYKSGFGAAFSAEYYFSDRWGIKGRVQYDQKGWANGFLTTTATTSIETGYKTSYITVPVMANWHFGKKRNWYLNFGPYVGFLLSAEASQATGYDVKSFFNGTDAGIDLGIGIKFPVADKAKIFLELGGQGGVLEVSKTTAPGSYNFQNNVSNLRVGVNF